MTTIEKSVQRHVERAIRYGHTQPTLRANVDGTWEASCPSCGRGFTAEANDDGVMTSGMLAAPVPCGVKVPGLEVRH